MDTYLYEHETIQREYKDASSILVLHLLKSLVKSDTPILIDLREYRNIKFLSTPKTCFQELELLKSINSTQVSLSSIHSTPINSSRSIESERCIPSKQSSIKKVKKISSIEKGIAEDVFLYGTVFASGITISDSMMNSLLYQSFYNPFLYPILKFFCGHRTESELKKDANLRMESVSLLTLSCQHISQSTYGQAFTYLLEKHSILVMGMYRHEQEFVYTNPLSDEILSKTDLLYVLSTPFTLNDLVRS